MLVVGAPAPAVVAATYSVVVVNDVAAVDGVAVADGVVAVDVVTVVVHACGPRMMLTLRGVSR